MIEMVVRTVDHNARSGHPVVLLLPRDRAVCGPVAVPISSSDACSLSHELDGLSTPRTRAYALLTQALHAVGGYLAAIIFEAGPDGQATARLQVGLPQGWATHPAEPSVALGLSVHTSLPVLVSEQLARRVQSDARLPVDPATTPEDRPMTDRVDPSVPAPFRHALDN